MKIYYVYILTNTRNSVFYIGVTNNLERRTIEHANNVHKLVYFEEYSEVADALRREKQLKNWHRDWKINLIKGANPQMIDLRDAETSSA